jgi:predicted nucleic acid-binding protein
MDDAWRMYDALIGDRRVEFAAEPVGLEAIWRSHTARQSFSPKLWNDAYLSAFAQTVNWRLVSCDKGFSQFGKLNVTILV